MRADKVEKIPEFDAAQTAISQVANATRDAVPLGIELSLETDNHNLQARRE